MSSQLAKGICQVQEHGGTLLLIKPGIVAMNLYRRKSVSVKYCIASLSAIFVSLMLFVTACKSHSNDSKKIFRYNESAGIATLDPAFAKNQSIIWAVHQIYNTLIETDDDMNMRPSLASSWDVTPDRLIYVFHLRHGVYFHDNDAFPNGRGRLMTAHDVEYSFKRIIDRSTASSGAWIFNGRVDSLAGFKALNDSTFQLKLVKPFNPILGLLSMKYCSIIPKEVVEKYGKDFRSHPCGTGPFRFQVWEEGQALILAKNNKYFELDSAGNRLPYLDAIKISFFDNKATEFLLFQQGLIDFQNEIDASFKDEILSKNGDLKKEWKGRIILQKHPYLNIEYLGILQDAGNPVVTGSPLRDLKLRQAINYGIDRKKMMLYLRNSIGIPAESGFVPAGLPSFDTSVVKGYTYNPQKARRLLTEAGFTNGQGLPVIKLLTVAVYADLGSYIAKELEDIGIRIQVEVIQKSLLLEQTAKSQALFFRGSWIADYPDAENYLSVFYSKNPAPPNYTRYSNPKFDLLYERSLIENNDSVKLNLYRQMDQLVMNDSPVVPLWYDELIHLINPRVINMHANGLNLLELRRTRVSD